MGATVRIAILANAAKAKAEMQSVAKEGSQLGATLKTGIVGGAVAAGVALGVMAKDAIAGARESAQIHRVLESQINAMGEASRTAFTGATQFAQDYGKAIGKDDDDILKVINKLSTFPAAFGKGTLGAEGMRRATQAAFDLEAAGVGKAEGNIIGLGKALDNPIKGLTALSKSGVSFTAQQKEQITNYVKAGKLAEAQKVLLAGIETNAKGAAGAQADGLTRAKVALDGLTEGFATAALPLLDKFGNFFSTTLAPKIESAFVLIQDSIGAFVTAFQTKNPTGAFTDGLLGVQQAGFRVRQAFDVLKVVIGAVIATVTSVTSFFIKYQAVLVPVAAGVLAIVAAMKIYNVTMTIIKAVTTAYTAVQAALNVVMAANPIGLVVLAIIGLVAALVVAYKRSETFRKIVDGAFRGVLNAARAVWNWIKSNWPLILAIITGPIGLAVRFVVRHFDTIKAKVKAVPKAISGAFKNANTLLVSAGRRVVEGLWSGITGLAGWLRDKVTSFITSTVPGPIARALGIASPSRVARRLAQFVPQGIALGLADGTGKVTRAAKVMAGATIAPLATTNGTAAITGGGARGGGASLTLTFEPSGDPLMDAIWDAFVKRLRVKGGARVVNGRVVFP